ncbi:MAG: DUF5666 domain-containing protein [Pelagimonas sp.]|nr:DUF5666 domain-containing protein [Pelagimonas sp.]
MRLLTVLALVCAPLALMAEEKEGGVIGTGIMGEITALGSIYVNGQHIRFAPDMALDGLETRADLTVGMTVAAAVQRDGADWLASAIRHVPVLRGPVTGPGEVMGIPVSGTDLPARGHVQIDGFWTAEGVIATRLRAIAQGPAQVSGPYDTDAEGMDRVAGLRFAGIAPQHLEPGQIITVSGAFEQGLLQAQSLERGLFPGAQPDLVLAQGYLSAPDPSGIYRLIGAGVVAFTDQPQMITPSNEVLRCALHGRMDFDRDALTSEARAALPALCFD